MVLILPRQKVIFVHIPKTGGNSIRMALQPCGGHDLGIRVSSPYNHVTAQQAKQRMPDWDDYFSFAVMREANSHARSFYQTMRWPGSFEDFLLNGEVPDQRSFTHDAEGQQIVSYVACFERLAEEYAMIARRFDLPECLPWVGRSRPFEP